MNEIRRLVAIVTSTSSADGQSLVLEMETDAGREFLSIKADAVADFITGLTHGAAFLNPVPSLPVQQARSIDVLTNSQGDVALAFEVAPNLQQSFHIPLGDLYRVRDGLDVAIQAADQAKKH